MDSGREPRRAERRHGRVPFRVFVSVRCDVDGDCTGGFSRDIGKGGIYVFTEALLDKGSKVEVCITQTPELIVVYGDVKRSERYLDGKAGAAVEITRWERMDFHLR